MTLTRTAALSIVLVIAAAIGASATAAPIFLDLSSGSQSTSASAGDAYNFLINGDENPLALNDSTGAATGVTVTKPNVGGGGGAAAPAGAQSISGDAAAAGITLTAGASYHYSNTTNAMVYTFAGLDAGSTYDFTLFASRNAGDTRPTDYSLSNGTTTLTGSLQPSGPVNNSEVLVLSGIAPSGANELELSFIGTNTSGNQFGYLNAVRIDVVPEPASLALAGFGGLTLVRRRPTRG